MKKKSLILVLLFLVCLTACGDTALKEGDTQTEKVVEKQEQTKTETKNTIVGDPKKTTSKSGSKDPTTLNYWIVFYDFDGVTELQRTAEPYGATPEYKGENPSKTIGSTRYVFTGWDKELKPITTNTYIYAQANKANIASSSPAPQPQPVEPTEPTVVPITPVVEPTYRVTLSPFWPFIIVRPGN